MKIYRDFVSMKPGEGTCRVEIELTSQEMADIFYAKQHEWDMDYVIELAEMNYDEDWPETVERFNALRSDPELCSEVAYRYRKYLSDWVTGDAEAECFRDAYTYTIRD